jgi:4'-phosphopantetheinyl transferase EntD
MSRSASNIARLLYPVSAEDLFTSPFPAELGFAVVPVDGSTSGVVLEELALVPPNAIAKRKRELIAGRRAAHLALERAGCIDRRPILKGPRGEPLWPPGWIGAITHCGDYGAAVVAPKASYDGIGLDIEAANRGDARLGELIACPIERRWMGGDPARVTALFSAKEAIFKATYPLAGVFLDFRDARLSWNPVRSGFEAELLRAVSSEHLAGTTLFVQVSVRNGHVMASVLL